MTDLPKGSGFSRVLHRIEDLALGAVLLGMVLFSSVQLVLRNVFGTGFNWGDSMLRQMVLWLGMLGAAVATRQDRHINVDLVGKLLAPRHAAAVRVVTDGFAALVCALLAQTGLSLVLQDMESGATAFADVPSWTMEIAIPIGFGLIAARYIRYFVIHLRDAISGLPPAASGNTPPVHGSR